mmetsp:Transcript_38867/g.76410  ORF Transcript_38867/g.76410 Transcript_38867/m.76410 type:complete len:93 (-) Transcript_38867:66-344(-)
MPGKRARSNMFRAVRSFRSGTNNRTGLWKSFRREKEDEDGPDIGGGEWRGWEEERKVRDDREIEEEGPVLVRLVLQGREKERGHSFWDLPIR